eukprot:g32182.t1
MKRQAAGMVVRPPKRTKVEVVEESVALEAPEPSLALTNESAGTADGASAANGDAPQSINSPEELVLSLATPKSKPGRPENVASAPSSPPVLGPGSALANKDLAKQETELIGLVSKIRRVPMKKGDVAYEHHLVVGGYQATVQIRCLDGDWKDAAFVGEVCRDKNMAEHSAAAVAVAELRVDHRLMLRASAPKKQPQATSRSGAAALGDPASTWPPWCVRESAGQPGKCSGLQDEVSTGAPSSVRSKPASTEKNTEGHSQWRARRLLLVSLWYVVSFLGILLNKELLSPGASGERITVTVLALVQMLSTVFTGVFFQTVGRSAIRRVGSASEVNDLLLLGLLRVLVTVLGLVSLSFVAASFTETIKASSPFFTVAAAWLLTGERTPLPAVVTLVPILLGLVLATTGELSFTLVGFAAALAVNVTECVQNVFCSWLLQKGSFKSNELQFYSALAALVLRQH